LKLKTRLAISFLIIIFVPVILAACALAGLRTIRSQTSDSYSIEGDYAAIANSLQLLNMYADDGCKIVKNWMQDAPDFTEDTKALNKFNGEVKENFSYIIVRRNETIIYNGDDSKKDGIKEEVLPEYGLNNPDANIVIYIHSPQTALLRQFDFKYDNGDKGTVFLVTSSRSVFPETRRIILDFVFSAIVILFLTAVIMVLWNYRGIVPRLEKLVKAADEIKGGTLDNPVIPDGNDEITELTLSFDEMRKRLLATSKEKMKNEEEQRALISNIAHDLKTPITSVKGYAEGLLDGVANTPEKRESYLRTIVNKANEMNALINELSLYTKIDTNRIPYNFAVIDADDFFMDCAEEIGMDLKNQKIEFNFTDSLFENTKIIADPQQLERVVHNIVSNSVKYMGGKNGVIDMRVKDVGDFIQVEIEDNGIGIAVKDLPHIFDRMFRADASRNSQTGGSGIGLSIVKKIIEDHGGNIWATSTVGVGTIMYFVLRKKLEEADVENSDNRGRGSNSRSGERLSGIKRLRGQDRDKRE
jgi:signal transduction histidine kinase